MHACCALPRGSAQSGGTPAREVIVCPNEANITGGLCVFAPTPLNPARWRALLSGIRRSFDALCAIISPAGNACLVVRFSRVMAGPSRCAPGWPGQPPPRRVPALRAPVVFVLFAYTGAKWRRFHGSGADGFTFYKNINQTQGNGTCRGNTGARARPSREVAAVAALAALMAAEGSVANGKPSEKTQDILRGEEQRP